jgi:hydrogenase maturation protein HypF
VNTSGSRAAIPVTGEAIRVRGLVQGVGFRPAVWRLAASLGISGEVLNDGAGVLIRAWAGALVLDEFVRRMRDEAPRLARVESIERAPVNGPAPWREFRLGESGPGPPDTGLLPDAVTCSACQRDFEDPDNRRYRYPFTNCTDCGPRFTLIQELPYDRERTTMRAFTQCPACQAEYDDPGNRRFHAQPNACPRCGPQLTLRDAAGNYIPGDPVERAARLLLAGSLVAIKGLGGYQLACRATDEPAVARLRTRKQRWDKPFAVMAKNLDTIRAWCVVSSEEAQRLASAEGPILLLVRRAGCPAAANVAPGTGLLGMMLPTTPLHHLLLGEAGEPLVMTSGNLSDEPIAYRDNEAMTRLGGLADYFLLHDRPIHMRADDSVTRVFEGRDLLLRRARGYAPATLSLPRPAREPVLAVGGQFKNTFCLVRGRAAHLSHHIGDLENPEALATFEWTIEHYQNLLDIHPTVLAHDLHPDYLSTNYVFERKAIRAVGVQHHHAHIASVLAEHGLTEGPVIGVAFDGSGFGTDGAVWGGEFLLSDRCNFTRAAHLAYTPLPGGSAAIREPWRYAAACLHRAYGAEMESLGLDFVKRLGLERWRPLRQMIAKDLRCPPTSSMGRLFDAVASLIGLRDAITYEGQAAVELEAMADSTCRESYPWPVETGPLPWAIDICGLIRSVTGDMLNGVPPARIAARFHNSVAEMTAAVCRELRRRTGTTSVALAGGVFQNTFLLSRLVAELRREGFLVLLPERVPVNDGGLAFGQAAVACARMGD